MSVEERELRRALQQIAPGTELREGLERIQRSHTGALIVLGYNPEVEAICSGGFTVDVELSAPRLRELAKMDGAVIIDTEAWIIRKANVQLLPDASIPTDESGMRHRTAQRTARQVNVPILSLSASMSAISIYVGDIHHTVEEPEALLSKANQAVDTLDRYIERLDEVLSSLSVFEIRDSVSVRDVATVVQRMEMIRRITFEINGYLDELGAEGRLLALQVDDLLRGAASERALVLRDYIANPENLDEVESKLSNLSAESLVDLTQIAEILGAPVFDPADLDESISPRGIRALAMVPRLPWRSIQQISERWGTLAELRALGPEDLQSIEGVGAYRARMIVEHLGERANAAQNNNW
ncbi:MAG: DNA integrity scanning diadenylate cyclase DisA [Scrofimicrobium sp.]